MQEGGALSGVIRVSSDGEPVLCCAKSLQSCPTLCDPMDYSLPGSSVQGILQARILEWVAVSFSRDSLTQGLKFRLFHLLH